MPAPDPRSWLLPFVSLAAIWGSSFLFIKVAVEELAPLHVAFGRCAIGAVVLLGVLAARRERLPRSPSLWGHLAVAALLLNAIPFVLFAEGETRASSVLAGIWNATTPLFALVFILAALPGERPTAGRTAGLLVGFLGVLVVLGPWAGPGEGELAAQLMFAGAAACYGASFAYTRRFIAGRPESTVVLSATQVSIATLMLGAALPLAGDAPATATAGLPDLDVVASMLALGALGTGLAYVLNYEVIRRAGPTTASTVTYLMPIFSTALGVAVLSETLKWHQPVGAAIVLLGIAVSQGRVPLPGRLRRARRRGGSAAAPGPAARTLPGPPTGPA